MVRDWLDDFLYRLSVSYPPHDWPDGGTDDWRVFVEDWVSALARNQVSESEADAARLALLETPPRFRADYIAMVIGAVKALREAGTARGVPDDVPVLRPDRSTIDASRDCPECTRERGRTAGLGPTGWASRLARWHSIPRPFRVDLFCRCPLGRWRKAHDIELLRNERVRQHDDLQARPELWNPELSHPTWSGRPCDHDMVIAADCAGLWWYADPDDDAAPIVPAALAGRLGTEPRSRPDLGRVEPAVPIPPKPAPRPEPTPEPVEMTEEHLEWM